MTALKHIFRARGEVRSVDDNGNSENVVPISFESVAELEAGTDAGQVDRVVPFSDSALSYSELYGSTFGIWNVSGSAEDTGYGTGKDAVGNGVDMAYGDIASVYARNLDEAKSCTAFVIQGAAPVGSFSGPVSGNGGFVLIPGAWVRASIGSGRSFGGSGTSLLVTDSASSALQEDGPTVRVVVGGRSE